MNEMNELIPISLSLSDESFEKEEIPVTEERMKKRSGRKADGKAPLRHSNFYCTWKFHTNLCDMEKSKIIFTELLKNIDDEYLELLGSDEGNLKTGLPIKDTRENLKLRIVGKIKPSLKVTKEDDIITYHFCIAISKRGLDTKINKAKIVKFLNMKTGGLTEFTYKLYKNAIANLDVYMTKK